MFKGISLARKLTNKLIGSYKDLKGHSKFEKFRFHYLVYHLSSPSRAGRERSKAQGIFTEPHVTEGQER